MSGKKSPNFDRLAEAAKKTRLNAYAPYSKYQVGAALLLDDGTIVTGCNMENAAYPAGICAERTAIGAAVSQKGAALKITEIVIVTNSSPPGTPCGICRQVMGELAAPSVPIHLTNLKDEIRTTSVGELLPLAFNLADGEKG
jgi:cytidine deaminase